MEDNIQFNPSAFKHGFTETDIRKETGMAHMTDEEVDALDELLTCTTPKLGPNGTSFFKQGIPDVSFRRRHSAYSECSIHCDPANSGYISN
jgi:hypothetical protein